MAQQGGSDNYRYYVSSTELTAVASLLGVKLSGQALFSGYKAFDVPTNSMGDVTLISPPYSEITQDQAVAAGKQMTAALMFAAANGEISIVGVGLTEGANAASESCAMSSFAAWQA